jgi:hypothetical protein
MATRSRLFIFRRNVLGDFSLNARVRVRGILVAEVDGC